MSQNPIQPSLPETDKLTSLYQSPESDSTRTRCVHPCPQTSEIRIATRSAPQGQHTPFPNSFLPPSSSSPYYPHKSVSPVHPAHPASDPAAYPLDLVVDLAPETEEFVADASYIPDDHRNNPHNPLDQVNEVVVGKTVQDFDGEGDDNVLVGFRRVIGESSWLEYCVVNPCGSLVSLVQVGYRPFVVSCLFQKVDVSWVSSWVYRVLGCFDRRRRNGVDLRPERWKLLGQMPPWRQRRRLSICAGGLRDLHFWLW